jgi:N-formylglutamate deformylase
MAEMISIQGGAPFVACAIHNGHDIRPELLPFLNLSETERLREEDPFTREWVKIADNRIAVSISRFEVDVNRPRELAVYLKPQNAWGLDVWNEKLPEETVERSLQLYDKFYTHVASYIDGLLSQHRNLLIYDLHSYNHRRDGFDKYADPDENPEINIGTRNLHRNVWSGVVDTFIDCMHQYNQGRLFWTMAFREIW